MSEAGRGTPFVSRAVQATKESSSLRVTIPQVVATTLGLHPGDELLWFVDPVSGVVRVERHAPLIPDAPAVSTGPPRGAAPVRDPGAEPSPTPS